MRFLVEAHSRIGDLAINVALFRAIAASGHRLEVIAGRSSAGLLADCDFIERLHVKGSGLAGQARLYWRLSRIKWDVMLLLRLKPLVKPLQVLGRAGCLRTWRNMDARLHRQGAVIYRLSILDGLVDNWQDAVNPQIVFSRQRQQRVRAALGIRDGARMLSVAPGAHSPEKRWPVEKFAQTIGQIACDYAKVVVVGSPAERELCTRLADACEAVSIAGEMDLADTGALVSTAACHLGNDSGLGHVAAGNGVATLAIGGEGNHYVPWQQHMLAGSVDAISVQQVVTKLREMVDK